MQLQDVCWECQVMWLWNNPILHRELFDRLQSWKTLAAVLAVVLVSSGLVLLRWPSDAAVDIVSQAAMLVFRPLACALTLAVMLLVPAFPATALVTERRKGTLALLLNSPMRPVQIYWGKLASNVLLALVIISASLPAMAACLAMGGLSFRNHIAPLIIVLVTMAVQYSAVGLWVSLRSASSDASLRWTYATVLALTVFSIVPLLIIGNLSGLPAEAARWLTAISPVSALQQISGSQAAVATLGIHTGTLEFVIASCVLTAWLAVVTIRRLDPRLLDRPRPAGKVMGKHGENSSLVNRLIYLVDPHKRKAEIPWWLNPVMVKEFRTRKFGRLHWLIRLVSLCAIISLLLTVVAASGTVSWGVEKIAGPQVLMQLSLMLLVGPSLGANLIASEVESGGWQLLRATPFSPLRILSGKLMSVVWTMLLVLLATLPGYAVMSYIQPALSSQVGNVTVSLLVAVAMVVSISGCVSAFCKSTAVATATSYGILLVLFAGTLLVWLARGKPFGPIFVEKVLLFNPAATAMNEMQTPGFETYNLAPGSWWVGGGIAVACMVVLAIRVGWMTRPD
jgi:ABC-type transport system involved in multi-copper enzyme maturation permease subunit